MRIAAIETRKLWLAGVSRMLYDPQPVKFGDAFKQPLLYFVLAGVGVFAVDAWLRRSTEVIHVTDGVRREVASELTTVTSREPTKDELDKGVVLWTETELLFREASTLGLADNDAVIRNHLARKLSQMVAQRTIIEPPTDDELMQELSAHRQDYVKPDTFTVSHVFVNRSAAPDTFAARVEDAFVRLQAGAAISSVGDHFPRGPVFELLTQPQLEAALGVKLGTALRLENKGSWQKLSGPRGAHFVRLDEVSSGEPTLQNSREVLANRVVALKQQAAVRSFIEALRAKYPVVDESNQ